MIDGRATFPGGAFGNMSGVGNGPSIGSGHRQDGDSDGDHDDANGNPSRPGTNKARKLEHAPEPRAPCFTASAAAAAPAGVGAAVSGSIASVATITSPATLETAGGAAGADGNAAGAAAGADAGLPQPRNPLVSNCDVLRHIKLFSSKKLDFLFFAGVSRQWRVAWDDAPGNDGGNGDDGAEEQGRNASSSKQTAVGAAVQSVSRLAWAKDCGCPWDTITSMRAASGGFLAVLQWARDHDCPVDEGACAAAAVDGHLEVLQWLRTVETPWNDKVRLSI